ncbi:hypothetical protein AKJ39_02645 [candidate division MSBL1 archaeon SCGC-AAA259J03]|uniref:KaiC domain-containing protein n=1 Tax=candidate division MSBL1 archaeon SCGC-AAA259J03 TaxID=1698269 RepID=A0A656YW58_9EURY|nr:hypothetical protein AKJ39_02645 [candidate division MSBL1 archaeon SCGC-AAA259J03]
MDEMLSGGFPEGHIVLLSGNTGTGKTTFGMQFLVEGMKRDEPALFVNLEEPTPQVKKTAEAHNWDFEDYEKRGLLRFVTPNLVDTYPDRFLHKVKNAADETNADRMVIDSVSSIPSAEMDVNDLRELFVELNSILKARGITCIATHLARPMFSENPSSIFGPTRASNSRLSSLTDGIILLRYIEKENEINKTINVLKMRGSKHSKKIREFDITEEGVEIGESLAKINRAT